MLVKELGNTANGCQIFLGGCFLAKRIQVELQINLYQRAWSSRLPAGSGGSSRRISSSCICLTSSPAASAASFYRINRQIVGGIYLFVDCVAVRQKDIEVLEVAVKQPDVVLGVLLGGETPGSRACKRVQIFAAAGLGLQECKLMNQICNSRIKNAN